MKKESKLSCREIIIMATLVLATIVPMGNLVIIPAANEIYTHFSETNIGVLNFILSGPALIALFVAPFVGRLMGRVGKKRMLLIGMVFFTVGAVFGAAVENAVYMAIMRGIVGVAEGIVAPCCMAIIADVFVDKKVLGTMMGLWNAGMSMVGAAVSFLSGLIVTIQWQYVFYIYLISIPIVLMILLFLPGDASRGKDGRKTEDDTDSARIFMPMPWKKIWAMYLSYFLGELVLCVMFYEIAIYMAETGLGGSVQSGLMSTIMTLGTFVACLSFGFLYARIRKVLPGMIHGLIAVAYVLFAFFPSIASTTVGMILIGMSNGWIMSYYQTHLAVVVPKNQVSFALGISTAVLGAAVFLCSYFCTLLRWLTDGSIISVCIALMVISIFASVIAFGKEFAAQKTLHN